MQVRISPWALLPFVSDMGAGLRVRRPWRFVSMLRPAACARRRQSPLLRWPEPSQARTPRGRAPERPGLNNLRAVVTFPTEEAHDGRSDERARRAERREACACDETSAAKAGGGGSGRGELPRRIRPQGAGPPARGDRSPQVTEERRAQGAVPEDRARPGPQAESALEILARAEEREPMSSQGAKCVSERVVEALQLLAGPRGESLAIGDVRDDAAWWVERGDGAGIALEHPQRDARRARVRRGRGDRFRVAIRGENRGNASSTLGRRKLLPQPSERRPIGLLRPRPAF